MKPKEYLKLKEQREASINLLRIEIREAYNAAISTPPPENLRPAIASDIVLGGIIWEEVGLDEDYPTGWGFFVIEEVLRPGDDWKAYADQNGCRRGLGGAFVENAGDDSARSD